MKFFVQHPIRPTGRGRRAITVFALICLAPALLSSISIYAQNNTDTQAVIERSGATIDANLAQKLYRRGNTYSNLQRYTEAVEEYRRAISADPNFAAAIRNLANTYYFLERYSEAKPLLARFIRLETETSAALIAAVSTLGELERADGNYEVSIGYDLQAIDLDPLNDSQIHVMANTYNNAGDADKAIQIYLRGIRTMPGNGFFDRSLGRIFETEGRLDEALAAYESAAAKDPDSAFYGDLVDSIRRRLNR
ncbi:MAG: tetratricopeptide repeat protein [Proteobacteria bacterium]|nr:tetratricopeptide repeat protein [Pseudomonadota bacterium]